MDTRNNILKDFNYGLFSLKNKIHYFDHRADDQFFECFDNSPITTGDFEVKVVFDKSANLLQFDISIHGSAELVCDRSLETFDYEINKESKVVYKYGEEYQELSEDLIILAEGTQELNIASVVYELIAVEIPFKKVHPDLEDEWEEDAELALVYQDDADESEDSEEEQIDPRWEDLKKKFGK